MQDTLGTSSETPPITHAKQAKQHTNRGHIGPFKVCRPDLELFGLFGRQVISDTPPSDMDLEKSALQTTVVLNMRTPCG